MLLSEIPAIEARFGRAWEACSGF